MDFRSDSDAHKAVLPLRKALAAVLQHGASAAFAPEREPSLLLSLLNQA